MSASIIRVAMRRLLVLAAGLTTCAVSADTTLVAVASNFKPAMTRLINEFETEYGHSVTASYASSGKLFAQIINGAPYQLFLSADATRPTQLAALGKAHQASQFTYAIGRLVAWQPRSSGRANLEDLLTAGDYRFIAIANPKLAPYGMAAQQVLERLKLWHPLQRQLVRGENIAQAMHYVASGNADLGLVALSQTLLPGVTQEARVISVPAQWHDPILQDAIVIAPNDTVSAFVAYLKSDAAQAIIVESGYAVP